MLIFEDIEMAKRYGNQISANTKKTVSIYKNVKTKNFNIFLTEKDFNKHYKGCSSHNLAFVCKNFETPFAIGYKLFKNKQDKNVVEQFATSEELEKAIKEKKLHGYNVNILNDENSINKFLNIL